MEVSLTCEDEGFAWWHFLTHICPLAGNLEGCLNGFRSGVHWEDHVVSKHGSDLPCKGAKFGVKKGPRGEGKPSGLLYQRGENLWVAMTLVDCSIDDGERESVLK